MKILSSKESYSIWSIGKILDQENIPKCKSRIVVCKKDILFKKFLFCYPFRKEKVSISSFIHLIELQRKYFSIQFTVEIQIFPEKSHKYFPKVLSGFYYPSFIHCPTNWFEQYEMKWTNEPCKYFLPNFYLFY